MRREVSYHHTMSIPQARNWHPKPREDQFEASPNSACRTPCVFHFLCVPLLVCSTSCASHSLYIPLTIPLLLTIFHPMYVLLRVCPTQYVSHSVCVTLPVYSTPSHSVCVPLRICSTPCMSYSVCVPLPACPTPCVIHCLSHSPPSHSVSSTFCIPHFLYVALTIPLLLYSPRISFTPCVFSNLSLHVCSVRSTCECYSLIYKSLA